MVFASANEVEYFTDRSAALYLCLTPWYTYFYVNHHYSSRHVAMCVSPAPIMPSTHESINAYVVSRLPMLDILVELVDVVAHAYDGLGHCRHLLFWSLGSQALDAARLA